MYNKLENILTTPLINKKLDNNNLKKYTFFNT